MADLEVGCRVTDADGNYGTVRYIGMVAHSKVKTDEWIGVEWDDSSRGKHDGSCLDDEGVFHRYFECVFGAGSFVKRTKLITGKSFLDVLFEKYIQTSEESKAPNNEDAGEQYALTSTGKQKPIEFVGEENIRKWQQLHVLTQVTLPRMKVSHAGEGITGVAGHFTYVDVQNNLISRWIEAARIAAQIPSLRDFFILGNRMEKLTPSIISTLPTCVTIPFISLICYT